MKWLVSLLISGFLTLALLDFGLFERERFLIPDLIEGLLFVGWQIPFAESINVTDATDDARLMLSTVTLIIGIYFAVRGVLELLPTAWFRLDDGRPSRLPDPRLLQDRVRTRDSNKRLKKLFHVTNGRWMLPLATALTLVLLASLPVALLSRTYFWVWGLSLAVPIALYCCGLNPDRPRQLAMTSHELSDHLTPEWFSKNRRTHTAWRRLRMLMRRRRKQFHSLAARWLRDALGRRRLRRPASRPSAPPGRQPLNESDEAS